MRDGQGGGAKRGKARRGAKTRYGSPFPVKLTKDQQERVRALQRKMPRLTLSDVFRALVDIALPVAEERPAVLFEAPGQASMAARSA